MIISVAIKQGNIIHTLPQPKRHHHVLWEISERSPMGLIMAEGVQGFLDNEGNFLDRTEALHHALACGQIEKPKFQDNELFSEDLW